MALPEKNAFTFQEIAQHFGVDEETVIDWIYRGLMHACIKHFVSIDYDVFWRNPKDFNDNDRTCGFDGYLRVNNDGAKTLLNNIRDNIRLSSEGFTWFSAMTLEPASADEFAKWPIKAYSMQLPHPAKVNRAMLRISRFERDRFAQEHGIRQPTTSNPQQPAPPAPPAIAANWHDALRIAFTVLSERYCRAPSLGEVLEYWEKDADDGRIVRRVDCREKTIICHERGKNRKVTFKSVQNELTKLRNPEKS